MTQKTIPGIPDVTQRKLFNTKISSLLPALFFLAFFLCLIFVFSDYFYPLLFGAIFGYILQRSRFCFTAGFRDIFLLRNTTLTRAVLISLAATTIGFSVVLYLAGKDSYLEIVDIVHPLGIHTAIGGILFGFGMVIAGACVSGCLVRLGEGYIMQVYTFAGLLAGSALGAWHWGWWKEVSIDRSPTFFLPHIIGWPFAITVQLSFIGVLYYLSIKFEQGTWPKLPKLNLPNFSSISLYSLFNKKSWSYTTGALLIAITNTLMFFFWDRPWGISSGIAHFSGWLTTYTRADPASWSYFMETCRYENLKCFLEHPFIYLTIAMVLGSLTATLLNNEFRFRKPRSRKYVFSALTGGVLMGYSSRLVMGCNIGGFLSGVSALSLHGWLFGLFILLGAYAGGKFLIRYIM